MGASLRDRAATPSEPSPAVSGIAGIPSAESSRERAERYLAHVLECRQEALEAAALSWDAKVDRARRELHAARLAEKEQRDFLKDWIIHDGGPCPVGDVPVLFRTKWEWAAMLAGDAMSIDEDNSRYASSLRWRWNGKDHDDIAAYRLASAIEARRAETAQTGPVEDESAPGRPEPSTHQDRDNVK